MLWQLHAANNQAAKHYDSNGDPIYDGSNENATHNIYTDEWATYRYNYGAKTSPADIDFLRV